MNAPSLKPAAPAGRLWLSRLSESTLLHALLWLGLSLFALGAAPLFDVDEGAFSEATRELLASGDWLHTTLNGEPRFDKPIGVYWLQALSVQALGLNAFALRLPSALSAWAWALALASFARPRLGAHSGTLVGWMLLTSLGVQLIGHAATADALLNLLLTLAALDGWRWLGEGQRPALRRAFAWMGLGLLVKGPVAVLVPGAAALLWLAGQRPLRPALAQLGRTVGDPVAWALLLGLAVPWYAYALHRHGMAFVDGFLMRHNLARYTGTMEQHGGSPAYYLVALPLLLLPWAPLLLALLGRARRLWAEPLPRYLLGWAGFVLVFFSLSGTKLPHYALYGASPLLLLMAPALLRAGPALRAAVMLAMTLPAVLLCGTAWAVSGGLDLGLAQRLARQPDLLALLTQGAQVPSWWGMAAATGAGVWLLAGGLALGVTRHAPGRSAWAAPACVAGALACGLLSLGLALPWWGERLQGPVLRAALLARARPEPAVQWQLHHPSFALYRGQSTPRRAPQAGELALTPASRLASLPSADYELLSQERGVALLLWRGATPKE